MVAATTVTTRSVTFQLFQRWVRVIPGKIDGDDDVLAPSQPVLNSGIAGQLSRNEHNR